MSYTTLASCYCPPQPGRRPGRGPVGVRMTGGGACADAGRAPG